MKITIPVAVRRIAPPPPLNSGYTTYASAIGFKKKKRKQHTETRVKIVFKRP